MATLLSKIFRKKPLEVKTAKTKDSTPIKIDVPQSDTPAVKIHIPKTEARPALKIDIPQEAHAPLPADLPAHHQSDAEMLSKIVETTPVKKQPTPAAPQEITTIDQVVAAIKRPKRAVKTAAATEKPQRKRAAKTKHDKVIAAIASRQARPARKQSKR